MISGACYTRSPLAQPQPDIDSRDKFWAASTISRPWAAGPDTDCVSQDGQPSAGWLDAGDVGASTTADVGINCEWAWLQDSESE
jgi:hypothetical protein